MTEEMKHVKIRSPEEVTQYLECDQTKFTLGQIHTLTRVASMVDIQPSKYKITSIFHLRGALRLLFDDGDKYCHTLLTMADPNEALQRLKDDAIEQLAKKGLTLDNRSLNTVYSSGDYKDVSADSPTPISGPRGSKSARDKASSGEDYHRQRAKDGVKFSTKATHNGFKLYALKPEVRAEGKEGYAGMQAIVKSPGITFEEWAKGEYGVNHLNWDLNRNCIKAVPVDEEFSLDKSK